MTDVELAWSILIINLKAKNGVRSKLQQYRIEQLQAEGFTAEFVDDYDNYLTIINICELRLCVSLQERTYGAMYRLGLRSTELSNYNNF